MVSKTKRNLLLRQELLIGTHIIPYRRIPKAMNLCVTCLFLAHCERWCEKRKINLGGESAILIIMINYLILGQIRVVDVGRLHRPNKCGVEILDETRQDTVVAIVLLPGLLLVGVFFVLVRVVVVIVRIVTIIGVFFVVVIVAIRIGLLLCVALLVRI